MTSSTTRGPSLPDKGDHDMDTRIVFIGGTVLTCDGDDNEAEAIAIADGRVLAVGDADTVCSAAGPGARVVDLDGATCGKANCRPVRSWTVPPPSTPCSSRHGGRPRPT